MYKEMQYNTVTRSTGIELMVVFKTNYSSNLSIQILWIKIPWVFCFSDQIQVSEEPVCAGDGFMT